MPTNTPNHTGPEAIAPAEAMRLLHTVRDQLIDAVANAYAAHLGDARRDLQQLALRASEKPRRELYESGHALLTNGGLGLLRRFREAFCKACDEAIASLGGNARDAWEGVEELSLVEAGAFERDLAIARLSAKAGYACSQQLTALDRRVAALLSQRRMDSDANPFGVKRLFTAFVEAAEASWAGEQLSLVLLETFEHYTAAGLPDHYRELNQYLVDNGVLPKLPVEIEEREHELERSGCADGEAIGDVFVQLASGLAASRGGGGAGGGMPGGWPGNGGGLPGGGAPMMGADPTGGEMTPMVLTQFIDGLTGLQRGAEGAAAQLGIDLDQIQTQGGDLLRGLAASPLLRWLQPNDSATVELVAMLFDCILGDAEVPDGLREELGKLQVPILKVALMNKGFFSDRRHPARRLLDVMAACGRGWGEREQQELLKRIRAAVKNVLNGFEQDSSIFDAQVEQIEDILHKAERAARGQVSELVSRLEQRDRRLVADAVVEDQIARRLAAPEAVPPVVAEFVGSHWRDLLARIYVKLGDGSEDWKQALTTLDELLWSVQPKTNPADRHHLMQRLPQLLDALPSGLARIGRKGVWEAFLAQLMPLHMEAIKTPAAGSASAATDATPSADDAGAAQPAQAGSDTEAAPADGYQAPWLVHSAPTQHEVEPDTGLLAAGLAGAMDSQPASTESPAGASEPHDPFLDAAERVEIGDWLEVQQLGGATLSLRATWMSRQSGLMLFADRRGRNPQVLNAERLAAALRQGSARLLSRDPLTQRAVAQLLVSAAPAEQTAA